MTEKRENIVSRFIGDSIKFVAGIIALAAVTFVVVFLLAAPAFAPYFQGQYMGEFGCSENDSRVVKRMFWVKIALWLICIISWLVVLGYGCTPPDGCGFAK